MKHLNMKLIILLLSVSAFAGQAKLHIAKENTTSVDAIVSELAPYLDNPMSWCDVNPTGIKESKDNRIDVTVAIHCDRTQVQKNIISIITQAMGTFTPLAGWDGLLGNDDMMSDFIVKTHQRFPWVKVIWNQSECNMVFRTDEHYGAHDLSDPIFFNVSVNGTSLEDKGLRHQNDITQYMNGRVVRTESVAKIDTKQPIAEVYLAPVDADGVYLATVTEWKSTVSFFVDSETEKKIVESSDPDVSVNQIKAFNTPGDHSYSFPAVDIY